MEQIPTAEAFLKTKNHVESYQYFFISELMIEFAKMHVEAALKAAYDNIEYTEVDSSVPYVVEESILNSYPLENIK